MGMEFNRIHFVFRLYVLLLLYILSNRENDEDVLKILLF